MDDFQPQIKEFFLIDYQICNAAKIFGMSALKSGEKFVEELKRLYLLTHVPNICPEHLSRTYVMAQDPKLTIYLKNMDLGLQKSPLMFLWII